MFRRRAKELAVKLSANAEHIYRAARTLHRTKSAILQVNSSLIGEYRAKTEGRGLLPADIREYEPGMDLRRIAWKLSARTGRTLVKTFEEERSTELLIALDTSPLMAANGGFNYGAQIAASIAGLAVRSGDAPGIIVGPNFLPPSRGRGQLAKICRLLCDSYQPQAENFTKQLTTALRELRARSGRTPKLVILIGAVFDGPLQEIKSVLRPDSKVLIGSVLPEILSSLPSSGFVHSIDPTTGHLAPLPLGSRGFTAHLKTRYSQELKELRNRATSIGASAGFCSGDLAAAVRVLFRGGESINQWSNHGG
jgi:uncharacterized protein (DUF58 family)